MKLIDDSLIREEIVKFKDDIFLFSKLNSISIELLEDINFGKSLKIYIFLTFLKGKSKMLNDLSLEDIFYNRYRWFLIFSKQKEKIEGNDPGINQQMVKILEEVEYNNYEIDWNNIQNISDDIEKEYA